MPRNTPQYLTADGFGRARGGYVCLFGEQTAAEDLRCSAPGTNRWRAQNGLSPRSIYRVVEGHIIGKGLGGDGSATLNGSCVNMVPQP
jgi:hypothetical protein